MIHRIIAIAVFTGGFTALAAALLLAGCAQHKAPKPLTVAEIPAALNQAFAQAPTERKELVDRTVSTLQAGEIAKALMVVEGLCAVPDLTKEQRETASRALLTLTQELQAAAQRGDKAAADFQRLRQSTR